MQSNVIIYTIAETIIGEILIAESLKGVSAIFINEDDFYSKLRELYPTADLIKRNLQECKWAGDIVNFIDCPKDMPFIPLDIQGTDFQRKVWASLIDIPLGKTVSYKDIATKIGNPNAVRAVANACGANKIPILIPCHRVIASDGSLGGYSGGGGIDTKRKLLVFERKYNPDLRVI